jgi:UDP-N-acetylglucosamine acyltransferase
MMSDAIMNSQIHSSAVIDPKASIATNVTIGAFCVVGKNVTLEEHVTLHSHDCRVGDNVVLANNATLAGHVTVGSFVILGGLSAVHQFVRIGDHAIIGGMTGVEHDVIPFGSVKGDRARLSGLNIIGLKRRGFSRIQIDELRSAYKVLFDGSGTFQDRLGVLLSINSTSDAVQEIIKFIQEDSSRAICQPKGN